MCAQLSGPVATPVPDSVLWGGAALGARTQLTRRHFLRTIVVESRPQSQSQPHPQRQRHPATRPRRTSIELLLLVGELRTRREHAEGLLEAVTGVSVGYTVAWHRSENRTHRARR